MSKVLTIVGAGPGLGESIAKRFGREGYKIGLIARDENVLSDLTDRLQGLEITTLASNADVTDVRALESALKQIEQDLGAPDVVVSNTSMFIEDEPTRVPLNVFETVWRVACLSTVITLQHVAPGMIERGSGTFLVPGTPLAINPAPIGVALGSAKAAARNFTMAAHKELKPSGVQATVLTINGAIKEGTPFDPVNLADAFWQEAGKSPDEWSAETVYEGAISDS